MTGNEKEALNVACFLHCYTSSKKSRQKKQSFFMADGSFRYFTKVVSFAIRADNFCMTSLWPRCYRVGSMGGT